VFPTASNAVIVTFCVAPAVCVVEPVMTSFDAVPPPLGVIEFDVAEVKPVESKVRVYDELVRPVKVRSVNVATPPTAVTLVVPPIVPPEAVAVTVAVEDVTVFPFASAIRTTGCVDRTEPDAPATG
jgi:hypothetical protein